MAEHLCVLQVGNELIGTYSSILVPHIKLRTVNHTQKENTI
jgi:hypothetical protein